MQIFSTYLLASVGLSPIIADQESSLCQPPLTQSKATLSIFNSYGEVAQTWWDHEEIWLPIFERLDVKGPVLLHLT